MTTQNNNTKQRLWATFDFEVTSFHPSKTQKGGLLGYATVRIAQLNAIFKNVGVFNNNGNVSVGPPAMPPCAENHKKFTPIMDLQDDRDLKIFRNKVLDALKVYAQEEGEELDLGQGIVLM